MFLRSVELEEIDSRVLPFVETLMTAASQPGGEDMISQGVWEALNQVFDGKLHTLSTGQSVPPFIVPHQTMGVSANVTILLTPFQATSS